MELDNIKQQIEGLESNIDIINKDLALTLPSIVTRLGDIDKTLKAEIEIKVVDNEDRKILISCIKDVNSAVDRYVADYGSLQQKVFNINEVANEKIHWIEKNMIKLQSYSEKMSSNIEIKHVHSLNFKSLKVIIPLLSLFILTLIFIGISIALYFNQKELKADNVKLRMLRIEDPIKGIKVDSIYNSDSKRAEYIVNKQEEEAKLILEVLKKRSEIKSGH